MTGMMQSPYERLQLIVRLPHLLRVDDYASVPPYALQHIRGLAGGPLSLGGVLELHQTLARCLFLLSEILSETSCTRHR
jgi:hypothetical protein